MVRRSLPALLVAVLVASVLVVDPSSTPPANAQVAAERAAAQRLRAAIAAESERIATTRAGLAQAERRLAVLDARVARREGQLRANEDRLVRARARLFRLQRRAAAAKDALAENLRAQYTTPKPNVVTVVLDAHGFGDLLERIEFYKRVSEHNGRVFENARDSRDAVAEQTRQLQALRKRLTVLAADANRDRDRADVVRNALLQRQASQLRRRDQRAARLRAVRSRIRSLERRAALAARRAAAPMAAAGGPGSGAPRVKDPGSAVARVVAAATEIASTPYVWGGGHGGVSGGYDCSGSISYALAAGGLLSAPLDSTGFMSWGEPGPGKRITVYANAGHAFMVVDGRRYDTSALSAGGTRWSSSMRSTAGFVARHPPGL
ncbi:hypothetical protein [Conexibacter sp. SYSU D00693]|uniref:coiled-coil domain-containing protein n=1 Tax=Conexibacter sp. SYSU D00693 TaxID=2812560 RepID=UPI00196A4AB6|nr:hypothetical protein [Conexibacter sp. SYSU D00693]